MALYDGGSSTDKTNKQLKLNKQIIITGDLLELMQQRKITTKSIIVVATPIRV